MVFPSGHATGEAGGRGGYGGFGGMATGGGIGVVTKVSTRPDMSANVICENPDRDCRKVVSAGPRLDAGQSWDVSEDVEVVDPPEDTRAAAMEARCIGSVAAIVNAAVTSP